MTQPRTTLLADLLGRHIEHHPRPLAVGVAGLLFTTTSAALTLAFGLPHAGIFAIFLASAALAAPFSWLLDDNREAIWSRGESAWHANRRTALGVLGLFAGMTTGFVIWSAILGAEGIRAHFGFALDAAHISHDDILSRRFGEVGPLFSHNLAVLVACMALAFIYRSYGALLALGWNAAVWGVVLTLLVMRALHGTPVHPVLFVLTAAGAVLPHLLVEAAGYVLGALAAIFLSRGLARYQARDGRFRRVAGAASLLLVVAVVLLWVGALLEQHFAPRVLATLR